MTDREKEIEFLSTMLALRGLIASVVTPSRSGHKKLITSGRLPDNFKKYPRELRISEARLVL